MPSTPRSVEARKQNAHKIIRRELKRKRYKLGKVARDDLKTSATTFSRKLSGELEFSIAEYMILADMIDLTLDQLFYGEGTPKFTVYEDLNKILKHFPAEFVPLLSDLLEIALKREPPKNE